MTSMTQWTPGPGIQVLEAEKPNGSWIVSAVGSGSGRCPNCESLSTSRHSRYVRHLQDLPVQGTTVALRLRLSRWRCRNRGCERQTFSDLLPRITRPFARRTRRVSELAHLVGHAAGGRPRSSARSRLSWLTRRQSDVLGYPVRIIGATPGVRSRTDRNRR